MQSYDLIVIGSGPAGQRAAIQAAKSGRRAAVIEQREIVGGVCITTGTIPSKTMREAVLYLSGFTYQGIYGLNHHVKDKITMADLGFRVNQVIKTEVEVIQGQLEHNGVDVLTGVGSFVDAKHVRVTNSRGQSDLTAPAILIATGTKPAVSPMVPINGRNIVNSDQILDMPEIPKTLIVVGGGVIGVEYACMFAVLGVMFYFLLIRPQQKQRKEQEKLLKNIKSGDRVLLSSGIFGMITNVKEKSFTVKIADNVKVEVAKSSVGTVLQKADEGESAGGSSN